MNNFGEKFYGPLLLLTIAGFLVVGFDSPTLASFLNSADRVGLSEEALTGPSRLQARISSVRESEADIATTPHPDFNPSSLEGKYIRVGDVVYFIHKGRRVEVWEDLPTEEQILPLAPELSERFPLFNGVDGR